MSDIKSCTVTIAPYSAIRRGRNGKRLTRKEAVRALIAGQSLIAFNINGQPCEIACSVHSMAVDCSVELREGDDCIAFFHLTPGDKAVTASEQHDIPPFMTNHPVELD